ncbi:MAG: carboxymuconolactone decarboxylase family protein [Rhodospirillaceae bacterium]|jgi:uncharacterized peroxidase-related enzyme|nr:carboxymuconolactone decarboxylase family protein [Rhodospirillaceae bacterium]MBT5944231.1 carboxymuconolactone decarboxylase family protein [Rhodospirillaceae bacterium]MBT6404009.1 carboxymuconolactone decarboxylase family protein [Rhodospirillaceae bacterium]MBT6536519.1 carboxymuconolactone decarboxylase family protein [Rhodospirillaceae bacterium]
MPHIPALKREDLPELEEYFLRSDDRMGFVTNAQLTMAHRPPIFKAFVELAAATFKEYGNVTPGLKALVGNIASKTAGCSYCMSHTASNAMRPGYDTDEAKVAVVWEYETNPIFSDAERAALEFAQCAASVPNLVTEDHIARLREHFTDAEVVEINAVVAFYGFLNRWNDSMATELEDDMRDIGERLLGDKGWTVGKHAAE